jgi:hypothetical protein
MTKSDLCKFGKNTNVCLLDLFLNEKYLFHVKYHAHYSKLRQYLSQLAAFILTKMVYINISFFFQVLIFIKFETNL